MLAFYENWDEETKKTFSAMTKLFKAEYGREIDYIFQDVDKACQLGEKKGLVVRTLLSSRQMQVLDALPDYIVCQAVNIGNGFFVATQTATKRILDVVSGRVFCCYSQADFELEQYGEEDCGRA
jgi:hypothetical protein